MSTEGFYEAYQGEEQAPWYWKYHAQTPGDNPLKKGDHEAYLMPDHLPTLVASTKDPLISVKDLSPASKAKIDAAVLAAHTSADPSRMLDGWLDDDGEVRGANEFSHPSIATYFARRLSVQCLCPGLFLPQIKREVTPVTIHTIQIWKFNQNNTTPSLLSGQPPQQKNYEALPWAKVLGHWAGDTKEDRAFRDVFMQCLAQFPADFFFWKTNPFSENTRPTTLFEMKLIAAPENSNDYDDNFFEHFGSLNTDQTADQTDTQGKGYFYAYEKKCAVFPKKYGTPSPLASPSPVSTVANSKDYLDYRHLASFTKNAPLSQQHALWKALATEILEPGQVFKQNFKDPASFCWLSTSGKGVNWLHLRVDVEAKYYNTEHDTEYRDQNYKPNQFWSPSSMALPTVKKKHLSNTQNHSRPSPRRGGGEGGFAGLD